MQETYVPRHLLVNKEVLPVLTSSFKQCLLAAVRRQLRRGPAVAAGSEGVRGGSEGGPRLFTSAVCEETPFTAVRRRSEAAVASLGADGVQTGVGAAEP